MVNITLIRVAAIILAATLSGCTSHEYFADLNGRSPMEVLALAQNAFDALVEAAKHSQVSSASLRQNLRLDGGDSAIHHCDPNNRATEKQAALDAAAADTTHQTIAVEISLSFGSAVDEIAQCASLRSFLDPTLPNALPIFYKGGGHYNDSQTLIYDVDRSDLRTKFLDGACYYTTAHVIGTETGHGLAYPPYPNTDTAHYWHGCTVANFQNGLSQKLGQGGENEVVKVFAADFRNVNFTATDNLLNTSLTSSTARNTTLHVDLRSIFRPGMFLKHQNELALMLARNRSIASDGSVYVQGEAVPANKAVQTRNGMEGTPQLVSWVIDSFNLVGDMMATQYTPLVLDLGAPGIKTTSLADGTYFDLGNLFFRDAAGNIQPVRHRTAWIGGSPVRQDLPNAIQPWFPANESEDGFLVIKPAAGHEISDARDLFGSFTQVNVNGQMRSFDNGFEALAAFAGLNCGGALNTDDDYRAQYVLPSNPAYGQLAVWVDKDGNGFSSPDEIHSLNEVGVLAIDACAATKKDERDANGNSTEMRAPFLLEPGATSLSEIDIIRILRGGKKSDGSDANFRLVYDIFFQANPQDRLNAITDAQLVNVQSPAPKLAMPLLESSLPLAPGVLHR